MDFAMANIATWISILEGSEAQPYKLCLSKADWDRFVCRYTVIKTTYSKERSSTTWTECFRELLTQRASCSWHDYMELQILHVQIRYTSNVGSEESWTWRKLKLWSKPLTRPLLLSQLKARQNLLCPGEETGYCCLHPHLEQLLQQEFYVL